jgi:hypothetical protein
MRKFLVAPLAFICLATALQAQEPLRKKPGLVLADRPDVSLTANEEEELNKLMPVKRHLSLMDGLTKKYDDEARRVASDRHTDQIVGNIFMVLLAMLTFLGGIATGHFVLKPRPTQQPIRRRSIA